MTGGHDVVSTPLPVGSTTGAGSRIYRGSNYGKFGKIRTGSTSANPNLMNSKILSAAYGSTENAGKTNAFSSARTDLFSNIATSKKKQVTDYMNFSGRAGLMISSKIDPEAAQIISNSISSECLNAHRIKQHMKEIQKK